MRKQMKIRMTIVAVVIGAASALFASGAQAAPTDKITRDPGRATRDLQRGAHLPLPTNGLQKQADRLQTHVEGCARLVFDHSPASGLCGSQGAVAKLVRR